MKLIDKNIAYEPLYVNDNNKQNQEEIALWRAVIIQALNDLLLPPSNTKYKRWRKQSIKWFTDADQDFYAVCEYAAVLPEEILKHAYKIILSKNLVF